MKRNLDILVISDLHLGTYGSEADEVLAYLKTVEAKKIVINGDFVDILLFNKKFWPSSHMKVVKYILDLIAQGKEIHYVVGNHDELLRKFLNYKIKNFQIVNQVVLDTDEGKVWMFHGDVFDFSIQTQWITKLAGFLYDYMIMFNSWAPKQVREGIATEDVALIQSIKGIGAKTAQRVIIDLKDKILKIYDIDEVSVKESNTNKDQALSALEVLGFNKKQADKVLDKLTIAQPEASVEELIKQALKKL